MADDDGHDQEKGKPPRGSGRGHRSGSSIGGGDRFAGPWWAAGECPDRRTFAAFLDKRLPPQHHQRLISHITDCDTCSHSFLAVAATVLDVDALKVGDGERLLADLDGPGEAVPLTVTPPRSWRRWLRNATFVAVLTAILGAALGFFLGWWLPARDPRVLLTSVVPRERPYAARFTGGMPWSRAAPPRDSRHRLDLKLPPGAVSYLAAAELRGLAHEIANASELGAIGSAQVLGGRIDSGIETLARAVAAEPESAELLSDLGAALLARAESSEPGDLEDDSVSMGETHEADIPAALELIGRALEKSPHLREALFNRALALERLYLPRSARKTWQQYLEVDAVSPWAAEARARLTAIVVPAIPDLDRVRAEIAAVATSGDRRRLSEVVLSHRHGARLTVQEDLLPGWAEAWLGGDVSEASRKLAAARALAAEWEAQTTDPTLVSAVGELDRADAPRLDSLARGYRAFGAGARAFTVLDLPAAQAATDHALRHFPPESTATAWAQVLRLGCVYAAKSGNIELEGQSVLRSVGSDPTSRGRVLWLLSLWRSRHGQWPEALATRREAIAAYSRVQEAEPAVWLQGVTAEGYGYMGMSGLSWQHRRAVAREIAKLRDREQVSNFLAFSAILALAERRPRVAAVLLDEALAIPGATSSEEAVPALLWRSRIRLTLGDRQGADEDFVRASTWFTRLDRQRAVWYGPDLRMLRGLLSREPADAIAAFSAALDGYRASKERQRLPEVLLARAQAQQRALQDEAASEDLRQAAILQDEQQQAGQLQSSRAATLQERDRLFDERVRFALRQGRSDEAFAVAEAARARTLRGTHGGAAAFAAAVVEPLRLADLRSGLEPGVTMLFFAALPDQVVQWQIERHRSSVTRLPISPGELERSVSVLETDLAAGAWTDVSREHARRLYVALIGSAHLGAGRLVVVPNGALHRVPFAALLEPATERFLVEERSVTVAPSVTAYVIARNHEQRLGKAPPIDALVVGEPQVSSDLFPGMHRLSGARTEARLVAALYPRRELLLGGAATRSAFVRSLGRRQVVHFAGHMVINRVNPDRSSLLLANDGAVEGPILFASDIAALDLGRSRTVVLSGCNAGGTRTLDGEVPISLARAFLAAGVPNVVTSLWPVPDQQSVPLVTSFHRQLRNGEPAAVALRSAQLAMLRGPRKDLQSPAIWASYQAYGG
jgi:CHAT domain-containing protein